MIYRQHIRCVLCNEIIAFKHNELTEEQKNSGWCGDQGGKYEEHICKQTNRDNKINLIIGTQSNS